MALYSVSCVISMAMCGIFAQAKLLNDLHTFTVSAGTLNEDHTATMKIDGTVYLSDKHEIVAPNGTRVHLVLGNATREMRTPLPGGDQGFPVGALVVATPGCGPSLPAQVSVFYFPGNTAHDAPCGGAAMLENSLKSFPRGTPVAMTTLYNQKGWERFKCPDDVLSFQRSVKLLGGKYEGSLGPNTSDPDGGSYKSAYLLVGAVGGDSPVEQYCTSEFENLLEATGSSCGAPWNGAWIETVNATLPKCGSDVIV